jgi:hypothetical protein
MSNYDESIPYLNAEEYLELFVPRTGSDVPLFILYGLNYDKKTNNNINESK